MINIYPYTDTHELNLDWILKQIRLIANEVNEFEALNKITFAGVWDITNNYPAWTIVDNGGDGFISLKPVPAGIDISNTEYWQQVANYSTIYADFNARITALENITKKGFDNSGKWVFLGDSYDFYGGGWCDTVINVLRLGANAFKETVSGHGFYTGAWENDLRSFAAGRTDLDEFKHIVIVGGLNDALPGAMSGTTLQDDINSFFANAASLFPNALVSVAYVGNILNDSPYISGRTAANIIKAINIYNAVIPNNGGQILHNTEYIMHNYSLFDADHAHPNASGNYRIAMGVIDALIGGSCNVLYEYEGATSMIGADFQCSGYRCVVNNEIESIELYNVCNPNRGTTDTVTDAWYDLGVLPSGILTYCNRLTTITARRSQSANAVTYTIAAKIEDRHLYIASRQLNDYSGYTSMNLSSGTRLDLFDVCFTISTLTDSQAY